MKINSKGFAGLEIVLIVVVLGVMGGAGFYIYNSNKTKNPDTAPTAQQIVENKPEETEAEKKYLEIPEAGVKFELTDAIKDAYYKKSKEGYIYFSTHYFDNLKDFVDCKADPDAMPLGHYGLYGLTDFKVGEENDFGDKWTIEDAKTTNAVQVGDRYYFLQRGNGGACYDYEKYFNDSPEVVKYNQIFDAFKEQQKTITGIK